MSRILGRDPARRCMPLQEWPAQDRALWLAALEPGDIVEPGGARAGFAFHSNRKLVSSYGRWLQWLGQRGMLHADPAPGTRVYPARVAAYVSDLLACNSTQTVMSRIAELHQMALVMDPRQDWKWLNRVTARVRARHLPARPKAPRIVAIDDLFALGLQLMATAQKKAHPIEQAVLHRDGLIVALLAARPLRRRNLAGLRIGHSLVQRGGDWWLDIPGGETKTGAPISMPMPPVLSVAIDEHIAVHRPILASRRGHWWREPGAALWLSSHGSPMTEIALYDRIVRVSRAAFGHPVSPHLFRDCAATAIAIDDPENVRIAAPLLGHRTLATTERYYIQAGSRQAVRQLQDHVTALRNRDG